MGWKFWQRDASEAEQSLAALQRGDAHPVAPPAVPTAPAAVTGTSFSMPVEDVFSITGRGTVVTGRIVAGTVTKGQQVTIAHLAGGTRGTVVTGIEMFRKIVDTATVGDNVGLLISGVEREDVGPGDVVSA